RCGGGLVTREGAVRPSDAGVLGCGADQCLRALAAPASLLGPVLALVVDVPDPLGHGLLPRLMGRWNISCRLAAGGSTARSVQDAFECLHDFRDVVGFTPS